MSDPLDRTAVAQALDVLYRTHHAQLVRTLAWKYGTTTDAAEDAVSAIYAALLDRCVLACVTPNYVYVAARRELAQRLRRESRSVELFDCHAATGADAQLAAEAGEMLTALASLKPGQRAAITDQLAGYSMAETAQRHGRTFTWTNRHRREGRAALRAELSR